MWRHLAVSDPPKTEEVELVEEESGKVWVQYSQMPPENAGDCGADRVIGDGERCRGNSGWDV